MNAENEDPVAVLEDLYRRERERIFAICLRMLGDPSDAEDATQETFARCAARCAGQEVNAPAYLTTAARNVCLDELARRRRRAQPVDAATTHGTPTDELVTWRRMLVQAWARLSRGDRHVLLQTAAGLPPTEIAEGLGITPDAAAQRVSRARRRARALLESLGGAVPLLGARRHGDARWFPRAALRLGGHNGASMSTVVQRIEVATLPALLAVGAATSGVTSVAPHAAPIALLPSTGPAGAYVAAQPDAVVSPSAAPSRIPSGRSAAGGTAVHSAPRPLPATPVPTSTVPVNSFTTSPSYSQDHTIFANTGTPGTMGYAGPGGFVRSNDGGRTWQPAHAMQIAGAVVLPPDFPADPSIFYEDGNSLYRSDDGGTTFRTVAVASYAITDTSSPAGDPRLFLAAEGSPTLVVYHVAGGATSTGPALPAGNVVQGMVVPPGSSDLLVLSEPVGGGDSAIARCTPSLVCVLGSSLHDLGRQLVVSPTYASDHTAFVLTSGEIDVTTDEGQTFQTAPIAPMTGVGMLVPDVHYASNHQLFATWAGAGATPNGQQLGVSTDGGHTFALRQTNVAVWIIAMLPDGNMLMTDQVAGASEIRCSSDQGRTWMSSC